MYAPPGAEDRPQTAFRAAEKKYKLTLNEKFRTASNGRRRGGRFEATPVDLSVVVDVSASANNSIPGVTLAHADDETGCKVYAFDAHPGFYYVSRALSEEEQRTWVRKSVRELCEPPARTNYGAELGELPPGLWDAACEDLMLLDGDGVRTWGKPARVIKRGDGEEKFFARRMLSKLRWATVGAPFNWTSRLYEPNVPRRAIGEDLVRLTRRIASLPPESWSYEAQAGLVNFYQPGDTLNAHVDDAERNLDRPIVSISLGCCGIFLLGQENIDAEPTAMMVRSGDAVILGGESRKCYHGVPRVFASHEGDDARFALPPALRPDAWDDHALAQYISHTRINISIRDID